MLLDCVYILEHHPNLFLANFWALNCVGNFTGSNLFEPELDLNLWSSPRFRHLPEPNHRSSSRFMEILKEPDRTGLRQHYGASVLGSRMCRGKVVGTLVVVVDEHVDVDVCRCHGPF